MNIGKQKRTVMPHEGPRVGRRLSPSPRTLSLRRLHRQILVLCAHPCSRDRHNRRNLTKGVGSFLTPPRPPDPCKGCLHPLQQQLGTLKIPGGQTQFAWPTKAQRGAAS